MSCTLGMVSIYYVKERLSGKWNVPKGHIKEDEEPLQGGVREFLEETEISLPSIPNLQDSWNSKGGTFYLYMLRGNKKLTPVLNHEHTDWGYFDSYDLPSPINKDIERNINELNNIKEESVTGDIKGLKGATAL